MVKIWIFYLYSHLKCFLLFSEDLGYKMRQSKMAVNYCCLPEFSLPLEIGQAVFKVVLAYGSQMS